MATITLQIDEKTKKGKAFIAFLKHCAIDNKSVELVKLRMQKPPILN